MWRCAYQSQELALVNESWHSVQNPYVIVDYLRVHELRTPSSVTWMVYGGLQSRESGGLVVLTEIFPCHLCGQIHILLHLKTRLGCWKRGQFLISC